MPGGGERQFARSRAVEKPRLEHTVLDHGERLAQNAFAVKWPRAKPAPSQWIVDDADAGTKQPVAHAVFEEARLTRDRRAVDRRGKMPDQRVRDARIEHHRNAPRLDLARIDALDRALRGNPPDFFRRL